MTLHISVPYCNLQWLMRIKVVYKPYTDGDTFLRDV